MKILFLTNKLPHAEVAGGHRIIYQRIRHLFQQGHRVGLLSFVAGAKLLLSSASTAKSSSASL